MEVRERRTSSGYDPALGQILFVSCAPPPRSHRGKLWDAFCGSRTVGTRTGRRCRGVMCFLWSRRQNQDVRWSVCEHGTQTASVYAESWRCGPPPLVVSQVNAGTPLLQSQTPSRCNPSS